MGKVDGVLGNGVIDMDHVVRSGSVDCEDQLKAGLSNVAGPLGSTVPSYVNKCDKILPSCNMTFVDS